MANFTWIIDDLIAGMSRPFGRSDFGELRSHGVSALVSLTEDSPQEDLVSEAGLNHYSFPIRDMSVPSPEDVDTVIEVIRKERDKGGRVAIHCGAGLGRTGTVLACYLVSEGHCAEDAIRTVRARRPGSVETVEQEAFVASYERRLRPK